MRKIFFLGTALLLFNAVIAQKKDNTHQFVDLTGTIGNQEGALAGSYVHNWRLGKKQKWELGVGLRNTTYFGTKRVFYTAGPARLTRSYTTPFIIFFAGQKEENFDTLLVQRPLVNSMNITANIGYNFSKKWYGGFNIDVIGFSFGRKSSAVFISSDDGLGDRTEPAAKPASFNLLLTGDHDRGSLNSEFFLDFNINEKWGVKGVYQFLFAEYKTTAVEQVTSDGTTINRFRNKVNAFGLGATYQF